MKNTEEFHDRHEAFTDKACNDEGLLPDRYVFVLTNLCNLRCPFCFQEKNILEQRMNLEDWLGLVEQIPDYGRITLTGGEPLLFKGFRRLFSTIAERVDCNIITNGTLLTEELIDFLLSFEKFRVLSISIDNIGNTLRRISEEQWSTIERMTRYFVQQRNTIQSSCILDVKTLILDENAGDLSKIHRYCMEHLGSDHQVFQFLKGSHIQHADHMFSFEEITEKSAPYVYKKFDLIKSELEKIRKYNLQSGRTAFLHPKLASLTSATELPDIDYINAADYTPDAFQPCRFPWSSIHINFDGTVFPCLAVSMGNVKTMPLSDIINGKPFFRFRNLIKEQGTVEACARCGWLRPSK